MKIAIISDIHSNLPALRQVFDDIIRAGAERVLCLGDIVGYYAQPRECLEFLLGQSRPVRFIQGNHERLLRDECWKDDAYNEMALAGVRQADKQLTDEQYQFLHGLPRAEFFEDLGLAISHDTFTYPGNEQYVLYHGHADDEESCYSQLQVLPQQFRLAFLGHIHIPFIYEKVPGRLRAQYDEDINNLEKELLPSARYLINPGSVGQPRDHDCRAAYGLLDLGEGRQTFCLRRLDYNVKETLAALSGMEEEEDILALLKKRIKGGW